MTAREFHVRLDGDDAGDGSPRRPVRTPAAGRDLVRTAAGDGHRGERVVVIGDGIHVLDRALVLGADDSGSPDDPIVYRAAPGARPVLSGGTAVAGWERDGVVLWSATLDAVDVRHVYLDGRRLPRTTGSLPAGTIRTDTGYVLPDDSASGWRHPSRVEFVYDVNWTQMRGCVASVRGRTVEMDQPWMSNARWHPMAMIDLPTRVENVFECLEEQPGCWYFDPSEKRLYVNPTPDTDMATAQVVASALETLVDLAGTAERPVHDVSFSGLTFAHTTWPMRFGTERGLAALQANLALTGALEPYSADGSPRWHGAMMPAALRLASSRRIAVEGCRFTHLGAAGLEVGRGCHDIRIIGNRFDDISGTAVQIGNGGDHHPESTEAVRGVRVTNNVVRDVAVEYQGGVGIWAGYVADVAIAHNDLRNLPYSGISMGWGWGAFDPTVMEGNSIVCNRVDAPVNVLLDGGGIYVLSAQPGMRVAGNVVTDQPNISGALYLDDGARFVTVEDNVVLRCGPRGTPSVRIDDEDVVLDHAWGSFLFKGKDHVINGNWWDRETDYCWSFLGESAVGENHHVDSMADVPGHLLDAAGLEPAFRHLLEPEPPA